MSRRSGLFSTLGTSFLLVILAGCGSDSTDQGPVPSSIAPVGQVTVIGTAGGAIAAALQVVVTDPSGATVPGVSVAWNAANGGSASPAQSSTDQSGVAQTTWTLGPSAGTQTLTATVQGLTAVTFTATALAGAPASVVVSPATLAFTSLGEQLQLGGSVVDANGNPVEGLTVEWTSSDEAVATVDATGLVTSVANGAATATGTAGAVQGNAALTIQQEGASIDLQPVALTIPAGGSQAIIAVVRDALSAAFDGAEVTWISSDPAVATVDATGLVTGVVPGQVTVTATSGNATAELAVLVIVPDPGVVVGGLSQEGEAVDPANVSGTFTVQGTAVVTAGFTGTLEVLLGAEVVTSLAIPSPAAARSLNLIEAREMNDFFGFGLEVNSSELVKSSNLYSPRFGNGSRDLLVQLKRTDGMIEYQSEIFGLTLNNPSGVVTHWMAPKSAMNPTSGIEYFDGELKLDFQYVNFDLDGVTAESANVQFEPIDPEEGMGFSLDLSWSGAEAWVRLSESEPAPTGTLGIAGRYRLSLNTLRLSNGSDGQPLILNDDRMAFSNTQANEIAWDNAGPTTSVMPQVLANFWANPTTELSEKLEEVDPENRFGFGESDNTVSDSGVGFLFGACSYVAAKIFTPLLFLDFSIFADLPETTGFDFLLYIYCLDALGNGTMFAVNTDEGVPVNIGKDFIKPQFAFTLGETFTEDRTANPTSLRFGIEASDEGGSGVMDIEIRALRYAPGLTAEQGCAIGRYMIGVCDRNPLGVVAEILFSEEEWGAMGDGVFDFQVRAKDAAGNVSGDPEAPNNVRVLRDAVSPQINDLMIAVESDHNLTVSATLTDNMEVTAFQGFAHFGLAMEDIQFSVGLKRTRTGDPYDDVFNLSQSVNLAYKIPWSIQNTDLTGKPTGVVLELQDYVMQGRDGGRNVIESGFSLTGSFGMVMGMPFSGIAHFDLVAPSLTVCNNEEGINCGGAPSTVKIWGRLQKPASGEPNPALQMFGIGFDMTKKYKIASPVGDRTSNFSGSFNGSYFEYVADFFFNAAAAGLKPGPYDLALGAFDSDENALFSQPIRFTIVGF